MIVKLGNVFLNENKIGLYKNISFYLLFVGLFLFIAFPFFTNRIYIAEKQMKNSEHFLTQLTNEFFVENAKQFFSLERKEIENFVKNSIEVHSQRGERNKFIMINSIYDKESLSNLFLIYCFINHFNNKDHFRWLTKDIQFNFILKEEFYNNPQEVILKLSSTENNKVKEGQMIDSVVNLDFISLDFESMEGILLKINGASSEDADMDYYKTFYDNLNRFFKEEEIRTVSFYFSPKIKFYLKNILYNIGSLIEGFFPKDKSNPVMYEYDYIYFLEALFENSLIANERINVNHLFISKGTNSVLIKGIRQNKIISNTEIERQSSKKDFMKAFNFAIVLERAIKNFSKDEIEIFRGEYNYLLTNSHSYLGVGFSVFIPVLFVLRIFYEILDKSYLNDYKIHLIDGNISGGKIIAYSLISFMIQMMMFLHIGQIQNFLQFSLYSTFFHILAINFAVTFVLFKMMNLNKEEEQSFDNLIRYIVALNCFNFFLVNYGFGLLMTVAIMPLEVLLNYIHEKMNKTFLQLFAIGFLMYCMLMDRIIVENIIDNFTKHFNSVYPFVTFIFVYFIFRINLIIRRKLNLKERIIIRATATLGN